MKTRVLTAVALIPLVLAIVGCTNPWPLIVLLAAAAYQSGREAGELSRRNPEPIGLTGIVVFLIAGMAIAGSYASIDLRSQTFLAVISGLWAAGHLSGIALLKPPVKAGPAHLFTLWFAMPLCAVLALHGGRTEAEWAFSLPNPTLLLLLPVWAGDIAAMLAGRAFGRHKLAPSISPNKTWEGAIANFLAATAVGAAVGVWLGYAPWVGWAGGAAVGVFGQFGDLFESALKRAAGLKDSGSLLPGHGGLLDRIDALLGSVIPVWLILHFSGSLR